MTLSLRSSTFLGQQTCVIKVSLFHAGYQTRSISWATFPSSSCVCLFIYFLFWFLRHISSYNSAWHGADFVDRYSFKLWLFCLYLHSAEINDRPLHLAWFLFVSLFFIEFSVFVLCYTVLCAMWPWAVLNCGSLASASQVLGLIISVVCQPSPPFPSPSLLFPPLPLSLPFLPPSFCVPPPS